jgi:hypothetical protein
MTSKTPEELAEDYALKNLETRILDSIGREEARLGFLAGYQASAPQWISVKDRLPKENILILCCSLKSLSPTYGWFDGTFWNVNDEPNYLKDKIDCISFITHWMPLPKPPEEEG